MIRIINSVERGPRTIVLLVVSEPTELRDGIPTEVVNTQDRYHRNTRELMKHLGYKWVGGNFSGEIWFRPIKDMFANGPRVVTVTYKTFVEEVKDMDRSTSEYETLINPVPMKMLVTEVSEGEPNGTEISQEAGSD